MTATQTMSRPADRPVTPDAPPAPTQVAATLRAAARVLVRRGWGQHLTEDPRDGRLCVDGALCVAAWDATGNFDHAARLRGACYRALGRSISDDPIEWNDRPGRAPVDVIAALRAAARKAARA